jgi:hypothetical protein
MTEYQRTNAFYKKTERSTIPFVGGSIYYRYDYGYETLA